MNQLVTAIATVLCGLLAWDVLRNAITAAAARSARQTADNARAIAVLSSALEDHRRTTAADRAITERAIANLVDEVRTALSDAAVRGIARPHRRQDQSQ